jgi:hypothetical protein
MSDLPELPILRQGTPYTSLDVSEINDVATGQPVIRVSQANSGLVTREFMHTAAARKALTAIPTLERVEMIKRSGEIFL